MSPVLIDQRRLLIIIIAILGALVMIFYSGYIAGIHHADANRPHADERTELKLPAAVPEPVRSEAVKPAVVAPGANIDVDVPDASSDTAKPKTVAPKPSEQAKAAVTGTPPEQKAVVKSKPADEPAVAKQKPIVKQAPEVREKPAVEQAAITEQSSETVAEPEPTVSKSEPEVKPAISQDSTDQIVDDASHEDARYSIQIGIYGSENNASKQVDSLIEQHLSGYYETYQKQNGETRYRVRFGYFASHSSASRALAIWSKDHPDSRSYIVQLQH